MPQNFISADLDQVFLMPPDMREWLAEDDLAWLVADVVEQLDLSAFYAGYRADGHGRAAFDPKIMVAVFAYAYALGVHSSREIERRCRRDVGFRVLARNLGPDHTTIARFRARHEQALAGLFSQVLGLCAQAGMVSLGLVSIDGTKIAANGSWSANKTEPALGHLVEEAEARFDALAADLLAEHAATDAAEDDLFGAARGDELPAPLRRPKERLARLQAARDRLAGEREGAARAQDEKLAAWQVRKDTPGVRPGRRPNPTPPARAGKKPPRANTTDPDSRAMRCQHTLVQGYNAQAAVSDAQVIVGAMLTQAPVDQGLLHPVLAATRAQLTQAGLDPVLDTVLADAGYANEDDFARAETDQFHLLAPIQADAERVRGPAGSRPDKSKQPKKLKAPNPRTHPATARAQQKLATVQGRHEYAQRGRTVEPVFGQIKTAQRFRRFSRRGLQACESEWLLVCAAHNLRKLHRSHRPAA